MNEPLSTAQRTWQVRVLVATWLSYAGFYFCRKNFAIVKSSVIDKLEISTVDLAHLVTAYLVAYMLGQFVTSVLGRTVSTRRLLLAGMALSLICNLALGVCYLMGPPGYWPMVLFMVVNGFAQATGWPGNVGVLSNWLAREDRGRVMAVWATSYQLGSILAKTFAAFMLGVAGAVWSFWGAAAVMALVWVAFYWLQRDHPEEVGLPAIVRQPLGHESRAQQPLGKNPICKGRRGAGLFEGWDRRVVLTILSMGTTYFVFKFLRYALDSWSPLAVEQMFGLSKSHAGYTSTLFDWVGFLGVLFAGWISDRFFHGRRYQTILLMTVGMVAAFGFLGLVGVQSLWLFGAGLCMSGFMLMGPDSLLSGVGAIDVGGRRGAVTAAGLVNGIGSIGPIFQEEVIGGVLARHGHHAAFQLLIAVSVLGILGALHLARRSRRGLSTL